MDFVLKEEHGFSFIDEGEGEVLLLLHGLMGALSNWERVVEEFSAEYRVIIPMLPIYDLPLLTTGVKTLAKFVHKFVTYKKLTDVTLLGNSLGGHVALIYVLSHPAVVKSMVLTGSSGLYENAFGGSFPRRGSYDFVKEKVEYTFYDPKTATRHNMKKDLHKIEIPVSLIWGREDKITPPEVAIEFSQELPDAELHWIEHCGHAAMMEQPDEFNRLLKGFLERIRV